jgi:hypothetical protein
MKVVKTSCKARGMPLAVPPHAAAEVKEWLSMRTGPAVLALLLLPGTAIARSNLPSNSISGQASKAKLLKAVKRYVRARVSEMRKTEKWFDTKIEYGGPMLTSKGEFSKSAMEFRVKAPAKEKLEHWDGPWRADVQVEVRKQNGRYVFSVAKNQVYEVLQVGRRVEAQ